MRSPASSTPPAARAPPPAVRPSLLRAPADVREGIDPWGPIPALAIMRRVKDSFDPDHLLAPGRFVGEI